MPYPSPVSYPSPSLYPGFGSGLEGRQVALGDALVLGGTDEFGVRWSLTTFDGWSGSPSPTLSLSQRARGHGATASESFFQPRGMTLGGLIHGANPAELDAAFDRLNAAVRLDPFVMLVSEDERVRNCMVQRQGEVIPTWHSDKLAGYSILVSAKDPLKYGDLVSTSTVLPSSSGGLVYPVTYPVTYTGVSNTGIIRLTNTGNTQAPVWLRVDGPVPAGGWTVTHVGKKQSLSFATSLALASGEFVTVDMERREVLAQGQSARAGYVTSRGWFSLDPGDNDIAFSATNYSSTALLTAATKPAWS
jgi:hypothetical protein